MRNSTFRNTVMTAAGLAGALALAACGQPAPKDGEADAPGHNAAVNAAEDAAGAAAGVVQGATAGLGTEAFTKEAAIAGAFEIQSARVAIERTANPKVKALARTLLEDHTAAGKALVGLAKDGKTQPLPEELDARRQGLLDNLKAASDADFDKVYLSQQEAAHNEAVMAFKAYGDRGDNAELKAFAAKTAPKLQAHADMVKALEKAKG